jgi:hypothetical protein
MDGIKCNMQAINNKYHGVCPNIKSWNAMLLQTEFHDIHLCKAKMQGYCPLIMILTDLMLYVSTSLVGSCPQTAE